MAIEELTQYIKLRKEQNVDEKTIRSELLEKKYSPEDVSRAFSGAISDTAPTGNIRSASDKHSVPVYIIGVIVIIIVFGIIYVFGSSFGRKLLLSYQYEKQGDYYSKIGDYDQAKNLYIESMLYWNNSSIINKIKSAEQQSEKITKPKLLTPTPTAIKASTPTSTSIPTAARTPTAKIIQPGATKTQLSLYKIDYYDIDKAKNKALADKTEIDLQKKNAIEGELSYMKVSPSFIGQYAIVFMSAPESGPGTAFGIFRNGKQVLIPEITGNEAGIASYYNKNIVLKNTITGGELRTVFVHELGHIVDSYLSADELKEFMEKRGMPGDVISSWYTYRKNGRNGEMPIHMGEWKASPAEDFAEVFKYIFGHRTSDGNWEIKTNYGKPSDDLTAWFKATVSPKFR